jgi:hypothetical protein
MYCYYLFQESNSKDRKKDKKKRDKKEEKEEKEEGSGGANSKGGLPRQALVTLLAHHPAVVEELVLVLRALEAGGVCFFGGEGGGFGLGFEWMGLIPWRELGNWLRGEQDKHTSRQKPTPTHETKTGQGVALDGIPVPEMRKRMGAFLDALHLRTELQGLAASTTFYLTPEQAGGDGNGGCDVDVHWIAPSLIDCRSQGKNQSNTHGRRRRSATRSCSGRCGPWRRR